ncbi:GDP-mannose 4,6-dehydratase [Pararhizobium haloflavum]|uniref:GDP-mannose 4,6-dehydratase n=1 Tax=Pararhizobium haloflavum TaxID=2037914 RepID=UPI000C18CCF7|nr:GDP-mannose 4,6-dehydratase [Pararhizobium haloflavum]
MEGARRIAITGAGGFVGQWLQSAFAGKVHAGEVELLPLSASGEKGRTLDITHAGDVRAAMLELRPDVVIHLAAVAAPADARRDPGHAWRVNVDGTLNIARTLIAELPKARLIFAGSSEAYGESFNRFGGIVDEAAPLEPMTAYAATKAAADLALGQMRRDGLDVVRFRPFNHTGPGQSDAYVVPAFASQIAAIIKRQREPFVDVGNLDAVRDFLDVRDVVAAYVLACDPERVFDDQAINLASGTGRPVRSILDRLIERADMPITVRTDPARVRPSEVPRALGRADRAQALLGWTPHYGFNETIDAVLDAMLVTPAS